MNRVPPPRASYSAGMPAAAQHAGEGNTGVASSAISFFSLLKWFAIGGVGASAIAGLLYFLRRYRVGGTTPVSTRSIAGSEGAKKKKVAVAAAQPASPTGDSDEDEETGVVSRDLRFSDEDEADEGFDSAEQIEQNFLRQAQELLEPSSPDKQPQPLKAIKLCDQMIAKYPVMKSAWITKAEAQGRAGKMKEMEKTFNLALKRFKNDVSIFISKMQALLQYSENPMPVVKEMSKAETRYAKSAPFYIFFGQLLRAMRIYKEAQTAITKAIEIDPLSVDAHYALAEIFSANEDFENALNAANRAERLISPSSKSVESTVYRMKVKVFKAEILRYLMRYEEALTSLDQCLQSDAKLSKAPALLMRRVVLLTDMERWKDAFEQMKAIAADKDMETQADELYLNMAQACLIGDPSLFDPKAALNYIDTQLRYHPAREASTAHLFRAMALVEVGRFDEAHAVLDAAMTMLRNLAAQTFKENPKLGGADALKEVEHKFLREWILGKAFAFAAEKKTDEATKLIEALDSQKDKDNWTSEFRAALSEGRPYLSWREFFRKRRQEMSQKAKDQLGQKLLKTSTSGSSLSSPAPAATISSPPSPPPSSASAASPSPASTVIATPDPVTVKSIGTMD